MRQRHGDGCRVPVLHHLFVNLKSFTYNTISEDADVFFSLYDTREAKQIRYREDGGGTPRAHTLTLTHHTHTTHTHTHTHTPHTQQSTLSKYTHTGHRTFTEHTNTHTSQIQDRHKQDRVHRI